MRRPTTRPIGVLLAITALAVTPACSGGGEITVHLDLPTHSDDGRTLAPASRHEQPWFEIRAVSDELATAVAVTGVPGESVRAVVPAGSDWTFRAALYPDDGATEPTHRGIAGPLRLRGGEQRRVVIDVYRLAADAVAPSFWKLAAGVAQTCGIIPAPEAIMIMSVATTPSDKCLDVPNRG
jgi:hypothetical protein